METTIALISALMLASGSLSLPTDSASDIPRLVMPPAPLAAPAQDPVIVPVIMVIMEPVNDKPTKWHRVKAASGAVARGAWFAMRHPVKATKNTGHAIVVANDYCAPAVRVIGTVTTLAGAYFFLKGSIVKWK